MEELMHDDVPREGRNLLAYFVFVENAEWFKDEPTLPLDAFERAMSELYAERDFFIVHKPIKHLHFLLSKPPDFEMFKDLVSQLDCYLTWTEHMVYVTKKQRDLELQINYLLKIGGDSDKSISVDDCRKLVNSVFGDQAFSKLERRMANPKFVTNEEVQFETLLALSCDLHHDLPRFIPTQKAVEDGFTRITYGCNKLNNFERGPWMKKIDKSLEALIIYIHEAFPMFLSMTVISLIWQFQSVNGLDHKPNTSFKDAEFIISKLSKFTDSSSCVLTPKSLSELSVSSKTESISSKDFVRPSRASVLTYFAVPPTAETCEPDIHLTMNRGDASEASSKNVCSGSSAQTESISGSPAAPTKHGSSRLAVPEEDDFDGLAAPREDKSGGTAKRK